MATTHSTTTAEQLLAMPDQGPCELVRGEILLTSPAGSRHGWIVAYITIRLGEYVLGLRLGRLFGAETGFILRRHPDTVRAPDVAFVRSERLRASLPIGYFPGAPDLAVEVRSPGDTDAEVLTKVEDYLTAGALAVWVVDPADETAHVYRLVHGALVAHGVEVLDGEEIVTGFRLTVAEVFAA